MPRFYCSGRTTLSCYRLNPVTSMCVRNTISYWCSHEPSLLCISSAFSSLSRPYALTAYLGHVVVRKPLARISVHQLGRTTEAPPRARHRHDHKRPLRLYRQTFHLADRIRRCRVDKLNITCVTRRYQPNMQGDRSFCAGQGLICPYYTSFGVGVVNPGVKQSNLIILAYLASLRRMKRCMSVITSVSKSWHQYVVGSHTKEPTIHCTMCSTAEHTGRTKHQSNWPCTGIVQIQRRRSSWWCKAEPRDPATVCRGFQPSYR